MWCFNDMSCWLLILLLTPCSFGKHQEKTTHVFPPHPCNLQPLKFNSLPLKTGDWKTIRLHLAFLAYFQGQKVSFRECTCSFQSTPLKSDLFSSQKNFCENFQPLKSKVTGWVVFLLVLLYLVRASKNSAVACFVRLSGHLTTPKKKTNEPTSRGFSSPGHPDCSVTSLMPCFFFQRQVILTKFWQFEMPPKTPSPPPMETPNPAPSDTFLGFWHPMTSQGFLGALGVFPSKYKRQADHFL